jgi:hypothetical protein
MRLLKAHKVVVETYLGAGPRGDTYAAPVEVRCFLDRGATVERTANAETTEQTSRVLARLGFASALVPKSRVTLPDGERARVAKALIRDGGPLLGAVRHVEVTLV